MFANNGLRKVPVYAIRPHAYHDLDGVSARPS